MAKMSLLTRSRRRWPERWLQICAILIKDQGWAPRTDGHSSLQRCICFRIDVALILMCFCHRWCIVLGWFLYNVGIDVALILTWFCHTWCIVLGQFLYSLGIDVALILTWFCHTWCIVWVRFGTVLAQMLHSFGLGLIEILQRLHTISKHSRQSCGQRFVKDL